MPKHAIKMLFSGVIVEQTFPSALGKMPFQMSYTIKVLKPPSAAAKSSIMLNFERSQKNAKAREVMNK